MPHCHVRVVEKMPTQGVAGNLQPGDLFDVSDVLNQSILVEHVEPHPTAEGVVRIVGLITKGEDAGLRGSWSFSSAQPLEFLR